MTLAPPAGTCTCQYTEPHYPAAEHDEDCVRHQNQCEHCGGLGCGLCDDTGNASGEAG